MCEFSCFLFQFDSKRKRKKTNRYGNTGEDVNMDDYFDDLDTDKSHESDEDFAVADMDNGDKEKTATVREINIAQIEAKLDMVSLDVQKILRMVISLTSNRASVCEDEIHPNFLASLPLKTEESTAKFEDDLNESKFRNAVVISHIINFIFYCHNTKHLSVYCIAFFSTFPYFQFNHLCTIHGSNGPKTGGKIIRSVVFSTICPTVLQTYTWSGSGDKNNFKNRKNIFAVFFDVVFAYDKNYTKSQCEDDMKQRIFKYIKTEAEKVYVFFEQ